MNTNHKPRSIEPAEQVRDMAEKGTERSKEFYQNAGAATTEAAAALQSGWTNAFRGIQEYNEKLAEFAQTNIKSQLEFTQKLAGLRSPTEFFEVSTKHTQQQFDRLTEQGKLLTALAALTDSACRPIAFMLTGGQVADCTAGELLLEQMPQASMLHGDKGYDSNAIRRQIEARGAMPNIPPKSNRRWKNCFSPPATRP